MEIQWPLALFTLFSSMGGCLFVFVAINEFTKKSAVDGFMPALASVILAVVGGLCSVLHLEHVERMMNALSHPTSGIFVEAVLIGCLVVCVAVYLLCLRRGVQAGIKAFAVLGAVFGIALSFMAGHSYIMAAVATWDTILLPTGYLFTALPMGAALYWALAGKGDAAYAFMAKCTVVCGILGFVGALAYAVAAGALFAGATAVVSVLSIILSGVVPVALGYLALVHGPSDKAQEGAEQAATGDEAASAAQAGDSSKADAAEKVVAVAGEKAEAQTDAPAKAEAAPDAGAKAKLQREDANVWIIFACTTVGALLYRVLMWMMYVAAYGFFGRNF